jgi:transposase InsO family protein
LKSECPPLSGQQIIGQCCASRSQIYRWRQGRLERKAREAKQLPEATIENAAGVIAAYPHFSGRKGQAYMIYHRLGYIGMNAYDRLKQNAKRLLVQELSRRKALASRSSFEHIRAKKVGEIWAEDFTELTVCGHRFKLALLIDVFDQFKLGVAVANRATADLVAKPVEQALAANGGHGPAQFLLSDNGSQYVSDEHGRLLATAEIVHRRIPACVPQYNGWVECEIKEFKNVFYNVWERRERQNADKEKSLMERVRGAAGETVGLLNYVVPRPSLGGVTPADVHSNEHLTKMEANKKYYEKARKGQANIPWSRGYWDVLKAGLELKKMTAKELLTKLAFFLPKPLRRIAKLNIEGVG